MEFTISRNSTVRTFTFVLIILAVIGGGYFAWKSGLLDKLFTQTQTTSAAPANEPAIESLTALYSPKGERTTWEKQVCVGMTEQGCELFRVMLANPLWKSSRNGKAASVTFIEIAEILEDGSQVWKTEVADSETALPVYIHVTQGDAGQWLLNRLLFAQEAAKYENQK